MNRSNIAHSDHVSTELRVSDDALQTKRDLAARFGVTVRMIELMIKGGRLPRPFYLGSSSPRWRKSDIDQWLERLAADAQRTVPGA